MQRTTASSWAYARGSWTPALTTRLIPGRSPRRFILTSGQTAAEGAPPSRPGLPRCNPPAHPLSLWPWRARIRRGWLGGGVFSQAWWTQFMKCDVAACMVEGGARVARGVLDAGCWDELQVLQAPDAIQTGLQALRLPPGLPATPNCGARCARSLAQSKRRTGFSGDHPEHGTVTSSFRASNAGHRTTWAITLNYFVAGGLGWILAGGVDAMPPASSTMDRSPSISVCFSPLPVDHHVLQRAWHQRGHHCDQTVDGYPRLGVALADGMPKSLGTVVGSLSRFPQSLSSRSGERYPSRSWPRTRALVGPL